MTQPIPEEALDDRLSFVGQTGSGKTYAAGTAVERLLQKKARVIVIDPLGVWYGLRLAADGLGNGFPVVIFGGELGDLPLTEGAGALIGETVAQSRESCIVSLAGLGTKAAERRFMLAFLTALYRHTQGEPVHLVFDEADMWAPQRLLDKEGEAAKLLGQMETIVRRGRVKGFIPWLITQRPAVLSKDVLSQMDGLIAMKLTSSQDRKAIEDWIEGSGDRAEGRKIVGAMPAMQRGTGVVWIPAREILRPVQFPTKITFDSSRTPKRGEKVRATALKPIDLGALRERLAKVESEIKANDPRALRARIAELEKQVKAKPAEASPAEIAAAEKRGYENGHAAGYAVGFSAAALDAAADSDHLASKYRSWAKQHVEQAAKPAASAQPFSGKASAQASPKPPVPAPAPSRGQGGGAELRILRVLAQRHPVRLTEAQWATLAGMKRTGGTWSTYKSRLRGSGYIEQGADRLFGVTDDGLLAVGELPAAPQTTEELLQMWYAAVGSGPAKLLGILVNHYPRSMRRDDLAAAAEMTASGGTFSTYLSRLSGNGLIDKTADGLRASDTLFMR